MISISQFRLLLGASVVSALLSLGVEAVWPDLVSVAMKAAMAAPYEEMAAPRVLALMGTMIVALVLVPIVLWGLYRLRPWAPRWAFIDLALGVVVIALAPPHAMSGPASALFFVSTCLWGAVLVIAYLRPANLWPAQVSSTASSG